MECQTAIGNHYVTEDALRFLLFTIVSTGPTVHSYTLFSWLEIDFIDGGLVFWEDPKMLFLHTSFFAWPQNMAPDLHSCQLPPIGRREQKAIPEKQRTRVNHLSIYTWVIFLGKGKWATLQGGLLSFLRSVKWLCACGNYDGLVVL